jgi:hypothetical protein
LQFKNRSITLILDSLSLGEIGGESYMTDFVWNKRDARREVARIIRGARASLKWSVEHLAVQGQVSKKKINLIENGSVHLVDADTVTQVVRAMSLAPAAGFEVSTLHDLSLENAVPRRRKNFPRKTHFARRQVSSQLSVR